MKPNAKTIARKEKFERIGDSVSRPYSDAITTNDPYYRDKIQPNPWRGMKSLDPQQYESWSRQLGISVMQIDTRPGLTRKESSE